MIATVSPDAVVLVDDSVDVSVEVSLDAAVVASSSSPPQAANVSGIAIRSAVRTRSLRATGEPPRFLVTAFNLAYGRGRPRDWIRRAIFSAAESVQPYA